MPPSQPPRGGMTDADFNGMLHEAEWMKFKADQFSIGFIEPEGIAVLSAGAPLGFRLIREALVVDLLLHISRLLDSAGTGQRTNCSLERAIDTLKDRNLPACDTAVLEAERKSIETCFKHINLDTIRNKLIAHTDLATSQLLVDWPSAPLTEITALCVRVHALAGRITELATGNSPPVLIVVYGDMTAIRNHVRRSCKQLNIPIQGDTNPD